MKHKTFSVLSSLGAGLLGAITAISVSFGNYLIPLFCMVLFIVLIASLKTFVKEKTVLVDERLNIIYGKAARITWIITLYLFAGATVVFGALSKTRPELFGYSILTSVACFAMMIIYLVAVYFFNRK